MPILLLIILVALAGASDCNPRGCADPLPGTPYFDDDGDGHSELGGDCDDTESDVYPGAHEDCGNGEDDDCDGETDEWQDKDGDGVANCEGDCDDTDADVMPVDDDGDGHTTCDGDCDDFDASIYPGATERCDGIDQNCSGSPADDEVDADQDGWMECEGDCDDSDPDVRPGAEETCDGVDEDCSGGIDDVDEDDDGYSACDEDCDDQDSTVHPGRSETCDFEDEDCDGLVDEGFDDDGDGYTTCEDDCDDGDASVHPGSAETCDLEDEDCDGYVDEGFDDDGDGWTPCEGDCDDANAWVHPGATEWCDGLDNGCEGAVPQSELDTDADGYFPCEGDCDDGDATAHPGATEVCDLTDDDCDGGVDEGYDGDGDGATTCGGDCDDADASTYLGAPEACDGLDQDCDGAAEADEVDSDGDGYRVCAPDCDDADPAVNPAAVETCDGEDDDCDGTVDVGNPAGVTQTPSFGDASSNSSYSSDFYANAYRVDSAGTLVGIEAYLNPSGSVSLSFRVYEATAASGPYSLVTSVSTTPSTDDTRFYSSGAVNVPLAEGRYYAVGVGSSNTVAYYRDGSPSFTAASGLTPQGYLYDTSTATPSSLSSTPSTSYLMYQRLTLRVPDPADVDEDADGVTEFCGDCDDLDADARPGAAEVCDARDNDCDGTVDEAPDADADGADACDDCDDADPAVNPDAVEVCGDGVDNDCDGGAGGCGVSGTLDLSTADAKLYGEDASDHAGWSVAGVGDVDGDGYDDVLVGARYEGSGGTDAGAAYLVHGPVSGSVNLSTAAAKLVGEDGGDYAGWSIAGAGDFDGDGVPDLLVGAYGDDEGASAAGAAYLLLGPVSGAVDLSLADVKLVGEDASDYAGYSVAGAGDVDGDGYDDVLVGAYGNGAGGSDAGAAYLVRGGPSPSGAIDLSAADARLIGEYTGDYAGFAVSGAGDVDGDGYADLLIGAHLQDSGGSSAGFAYLVLGPVSGTLDLSLADARIQGEDSGDYAGHSVSSAGDVNDDGCSDLLIGARYDDSGGTDSGAAYVVLGPVSGLVDLSAASAKLVGEAGADEAGYAVSGAGDVDADGYDDVLVSAYDEDAGGSDAGAVYLVLGPMVGTIDLSTAAAKLIGEDGGDRAGVALAAAGDVNGDGYADILVGAYADDTYETDVGAAYLLLGGGL